MSRRRVAGLALALLAHGCLRGSDDCSEIANQPPMRVASGRYVARYASLSDVPSAESLPEMTVDRDAGVVTVTRVVDGGRVTARYRILAR